MAGFEEKVVVITGSSGIGLGAALHLASEGVKVYVCGIDGPTNDTARQKASGLNLTVFSELMYPTPSGSVNMRSEKQRGTCTCWLMCRWTHSSS